MKLTARIKNVSAAQLQVKYLKIAAAFGLKAGVEEAAMVVEVSAKEKVPVLSGNLQEHIHTEVLLDTTEVQKRNVTAVYPAGNKYGFDPAYARRIELGFVGMDSLGRIYNQAPQPYMRPALDENRDDATSRIVDSVRQELAAASATVSSRRSR